MSLMKILDINVTLLKKAATKTSDDELSHEIEGKLAQFHDMGGLTYEKSDMIRLISSIETDKLNSCWGISAQNGSIATWIMLSACSG